MRGLPRVRRTLPVDKSRLTDRIKPEKESHLERSPYGDDMRRTLMEPRKLRVFLCHSSQDKPIVRELYQRLNTEGWIDPWLDEEKLLPGQDWDMEINKPYELTLSTA